MHLLNSEVEAQQLLHSLCPPSGQILWGKYVFQVLAVGCPGKPGSQDIAMPQHHFNNREQFLLVYRIISLHRGHSGRVEGGHLHGTPALFLGNHTANPISTGVIIT